MKKGLVVLIAMIMVFASITPSYADDALTKLGRGITNVFTSPIEVISGMGNGTEEHGLLGGVTIGLLSGTVNFVKRASVGVYEVITFPIPFPADYAPIIDDPEFFLDRKKADRL